MHHHRCAWLFAVFQCLAALSCLVLPAAAQEPAAVAEPAIRAGYIEFPPYSYTDQHGQAAGEMIDLVRLLAQRSGHRVEFTHYPSFRLFKTLESGQVEVWAAVLNHPVLMPHILQSRYRIARLKLNLYYLGQNAPQLPQDLRDSRVLVLQGFVYPNSPLTPYIEDPAYHISKIQAPTHDAAVQMLHLQRADYLLNYQAPMEQLARATAQPSPASITVLEQDFTFAFAKRSPRAQRLRDDFDSALQQLKDGEQLPESFKAVELHHQPSTTAK
ncbi:ABC transporter substrate-binding protein [Pseudomonas sp.]|uniref:substrate-binding periplasmic protein n=1 Tax=Pseudomonas sp. TaxID=306 RepID=UPI0027326BC8|nr:transporter substrate-binding domain-containing protein [Pseudomonas sp.]MDP3815740.1 transporter substrate-binding domain-containing protein [Pseudomonas sp.]